MENDTRGKKTKTPYCALTCELQLDTADELRL